MKIQYLAGILMVISLLFIKCKKDDPTQLINYDGANVTSPNIPPGSYELAARFDASELSDFVGSQLTGLEYYLTATPQFLRLKIYDAGDGMTPGSVIHTQDLLQDAQEGSWNEVSLRDPIEITGDEIWISIRIDLTEVQQSVGCDGGPAHPDGDYVFIESSNEWTTYRDWANESINWNIRGVIE